VSGKVKEIHKRQVCRRRHNLGGDPRAMMLKEGVPGVKVWKPEAR
jgi:hypothetical protein